MRLLIAFALCGLFALSGAQAGVAPALGGNKMSQSGAKISAPAKPAEEQKEGKAVEGDDSKESKSK